MKVSFTGGNMSAFGMNPATFTTEDTLTQIIIENSQLYKRGRIVKISESWTEEEFPLRRPLLNPLSPAKGDDPADSPTLPAQEETGTWTEDTPEDPQNDQGTETEASPEDYEPPYTPLPSGEEEETMTMGSNEEARSFLEETFGLTGLKSKTRAQLVAIAAEHGIRLEFKG